MEVPADWQAGGRRISYFAARRRGQGWENHGVAAATNGRLDALSSAELQPALDHKTTDYRTTGPLKELTK
jgi:hypothetical protein